MDSETFQCSNPLDRVRGFRGLTLEDERFEVDYDESVLSLAVKVARMEMRNTAKTLWRVHFAMAKALGDTTRGVGVMASRVEHKSEISKSTGVEVRNAFLEKVFQKLESEDATLPQDRSGVDLSVYLEIFRADGEGTDCWTRWLMRKWAAGRTSTLLIE